MKPYCCNSCNIYNSLSLSTKISYICENEYKYFLNKANVIGVGLGYKIIKGFCTFQKCIKVFVYKKLSNNNLPSKELVPPIYKGIKTDVVQSSIIKPLSLTSRVRPAIGGYSIGSSLDDDAGTLGCLVTDGNNYYILGNNHILAKNNTFPIGTPVVQPGIYDGGKPYQDAIATLSKYVPIKFNNVPNYADCSIAKVYNKDLVSPTIAFVGMPKNPVAPALNTEVIKVGNSTELTTGIIKDINATFVIDFLEKEVIYKHLIITTSMANDGDSGALLLNKQNHAIGLLMEGCEDQTAYNNISDVLNQLKVHIVTT